MLGKDRDGGYAEYIAVPAKNAVPLPEEIPFEQGAVLMCSTATSFHALKKSRFSAGESVAVWGTGGLGLSAVQLARILGAGEIFAVDIDERKLDLAHTLGAITINAGKKDPVEQIRQLTRGDGVDVSVELTGLPDVMSQAVRSLKIFGRAVLVGITRKPFEVLSYSEIIGKEAEIIGVSDHLLTELPVLLDFVREGRLSLDRVIDNVIPLDARPINLALDALRDFKGSARTVIVPG